MPQAYTGKTVLPRSIAPLAQVGADPGDDGGDVGLGPSGGLYATMRPGLRNALADAYGEHALDELNDLKPTVFHRAADPQVPGFLGQAYDEVYDPQHDAPIAARETARQDAQRYLEDNALQGARIGEETNDIADAGRLSRYWTPANQQALEQQFEQKLRLATDPALAAAGGKVNVANIEAGGKVDAARAAAKQPNWAALFDAISKTYPKDPRTGEAQLPQSMQDLRTAVMGYLGQGMAGGPTTGGVTPPGGPGPSGPPLTFEQKYQRAKAAGWSDDEIQQYLRTNGSGG